MPAQVVSDSVNQAMCVSGRIVAGRKHRNVFVCMCAVMCCPHMQVHADSVTVQQQRLSFSRPDGSSGNITVTPTHLVYKLTGNTPLTHSAGSVNACERPQQCLLPGRVVDQ